MNQGLIPAIPGPLESQLEQKARSRVTEAIAAARAPSTRRNYASQWQRFEEWAHQQGYPPLPARPETIAAYLTARADDGAKIATIRASRAAISAAHRTAGLEDPAAHEGVRTVLSGLARLNNSAQQQAPGLQRDGLAAIVATATLPRRGRGGHMESIQTARARGLVDIALASVMRDALLRRSEATELRWTDISVEADGSGRLLIRHGKTDPTGEGTILYLARQTVQALEAIRANNWRQDTPVFKLSDRQISRRLNAMAAAAGFPGATGHSPRVGMAQDLAAYGTELPALMQAGRWRSPSMPARYTRAQAADRGAVAHYHRALGG